MATSVGALNVVLGMNTAAFSADVGKARAAVTGLAANSNVALAGMDRSFTRTTAGISAMAKQTLGLGAVTRVAMTYLAPAAIIAFGRSAFNAAAGIKEAAEQVGMGVEAYQAFRAALQDSGVSLEQGDVLLARFTKQMGAAQEGAGSARDALVALGLSSKDMAGGAEQFIGKFVTALLKIPDATERARIETEFLGRSGQKLESALVALGIPVDELTAKYKAQGRVLSEELTKKADEASDRMGAAWQRLQISAAGPLNFIVDRLTFIIGLVSSVGSGISAAASDMAHRGTAADILTRETTNPVRSTAAISARARTAGIPFAPKVVPATSAGSDWKSREQEAATKKALDEQTKAHEEYVRDWERGTIRVRGFEQDFLKEWKTETVVAWDDFKKFQLARPTLVENATEKINAAYAREQEALRLIHEGQMEMMRQEAYAADSLRYSVTNVGVAALHGFGSFKQAVAGVLEQLAAMIIQLRVMKPIVEGLFGAEGSGFGGSIGGLIGSALGYLGGGGSSAGMNLDYSGTGHGFGNFRAAGGPVSAGRPYIVGEKGPETFVPRSSGNIVPNGGGMGGGEVVVRIELDNQMLRATVQSESGNVVARFNKQALPGRVRELTRDARLG